MTWNTLAGIAEIVGALGVVISLVYLAIQIRTNTKAIKASSSFAVVHSDLTDVEYFRFAVMQRTIFQSLKGSTMSIAMGFLEPGVWKNRARVTLPDSTYPYCENGGNRN